MISRKELAKIFRRVNYEVEESESNRLYLLYSKSISLKSVRRSIYTRSTGLTFEECASILHQVRCDSTRTVRPALQILIDIFEKQIDHGKILERISAESFLNRFILTKQGESNTTIENIQQIFHKLNQMEIPDGESNANTEDSSKDLSTRLFESINVDQFEAYLMSKENDIFDPVKQEFDKSLMNKPLSEFWVNSSHNTYLTGDQLLSRSSVEMYTNALYQGTRCLELDCWDGDKLVPIIKHGYA